MKRENYNQRTKHIMVFLLCFCMIISVVIPKFESRAASGWKCDAGGWWYEYGDSYYKNQWAKIGGYWYYFTASGYMDYSEYRDGYWLGSDGAWNEAYYGGHWESNAVGWWYEDRSGWYPVSMWLWVDGSCYYFKSNGYMASNEWIDGCYVDNNGAWIPNYNGNPDPNNPNGDYKYGNKVVETTEDKLLTYAKDVIFLRQPFAPIKKSNGSDITCNDLNSNNFSSEELDSCTKDYNKHYTYAECGLCKKKYWSDKDGDQGVDEAVRLYRENDLCRRFELFESELDMPNWGVGDQTYTSREYFLDEDCGVAWCRRQYLEVYSNEGQTHYFDTKAEADKNGATYYRSYPFMGMHNRYNYDDGIYYNIKLISSEDVFVERTYTIDYNNEKRLISYRWWRKDNPKVVYNSLKRNEDNEYKDESGITVSAPIINVDLEKDINNYGDKLQKENEYIEEEDPNKKKVESYSYSIEPVMTPFNMYYYVKTDNPDPRSFSFIDRDSKYYKENDPYNYITILNKLFMDVKYEDESIYRVNGGYLFYAPNDNYASNKMDGGELILRYRGTDKIFEDTDVKVNCPEVKPLFEYFNDEFTTADMSVLEKIKAVDKGVNELSYYPDYRADKNKASQKYPCLTSAPYADQGVLMAGYVNYGDSSKYLLMEWAYPFMLTSASQPGTILAYARYLDNNIEYKQTYFHYLYEVYYNGDKITVGGAGRECKEDIIFESDVEKVFLFDKSENDAFTQISKDWVWEKKQYYNEKSAPVFEENKNKVNYKTITEVLGNKGSWIRIAGGYYSYLYMNESPNYANKTVSPISNAWVDGRYINNKGQNVSGVRFKDNPGEYMIIKVDDPISFKGITYKGETEYRYSEKYDMWFASSLYWDALDELDGNGSLDTYPDELVVTRKEADQMNVDRNTNDVPQSGYIYDGTVEPGTPFFN